jgi:hypothetical protein
MFLPGTRQLFAVAAILTAMIPLSASSAQRAGVDTTSALVAPSLRPGMRVRVAWPDGGVVSGRLVRRTPDSLIVSDGAADWPVALGEVRGLWVAHGRSTRAGARIGGLAGGITGGVLGVLFGAFGCELTCSRSRVTGAVAGLASGAVLGALVGGTVGTSLPRWRAVLP